MNWNDPNSVAIFAAWGQWAGAIASLLAVIIAVWIALQSSKETRKQFQQGRYDNARPVLAVSSSDNGMHTDSDCPRLMSNGVDKQTVTISNVGTGPAFDIMSIICASELILCPNRSPIQLYDVHWTYIASNFIVGDSKPCSHERNVGIFEEGYRKIDPHSFYAPAQPKHIPGSMSQEPAYICRVTTTYRDIFKRKHASIFDLDSKGNWIKVDILENISDDLHDLRGYHQPPLPPLSKRLKRFVPRLVWPNEEL